jgi:hypothetical protein
MKPTEDNSLRAKTVSFHRGLDPKDSMGIGYAGRRKFLKDIESGYFFGSLEVLMEGLEIGYISEEEADHYLTNGISENAPKSWQWTEGFRKTREIYWNSFEKSLNIDFYLPDYKKIRTWVGKIHFNGVYYFKMRTTCTDSRGLGYKFQQENIFEPDDYAFTIKFIMSQINKVLAESIKNIG